MSDEATTDQPHLAFDAVLRRANFADLSQASQKRVSKFGKSNLIYALAYWLAAVVLSVALLRAADQVAVAIDDTALIGPGELALIAMLIGMVMALILTTLLGRATVARYLDQGFREGGSYLGARRYTLDARGIAAEGANGYSLTLWSAVLDMSEAPDTFLLWTDPVAAVMVPKDAFATAEERERFTAFVTARLASGQS